MMKEILAIVGPTAVGKTAIGIKLAKKYGEVGLVVDGKTPVDAIKVPFEDLDCLLFMTINAGFSGQAFDSAKLEKVNTVRAQTSIPIEVDGGISDQTIKIAKQAGATRFISTSFLFGQNNPEEQYRKLQQLVNS